MARPPFRSARAAFPTSRWRGRESFRGATSISPDFRRASISSNAASILGCAWKWTCSDPREHICPRLLPIGDGELPAVCAADRNRGGLPARLRQPAHVCDQGVDVGRPEVVLEGGHLDALA